MTKTIVIHQPDFLPYLGFFHRFLHADLWVVLDSVQFLNNSKSWHNRDKIKTANGTTWLSASVQKCPQKTPIDEVLFSSNDWKQKNLALINHNYKKSPYYDEIFPYIKKIYAFESEKMIDFNLNAIKILCSMFQTEINYIKASELNSKGQKTELLLDIAKKTASTHYLSGIGARNYLDESVFEKENIKVLWQNFKHPIYPQLFGEFIPYLSSIDLLFNCGLEESRKILRN